MATKKKSSKPKAKKAAKKKSAAKKPGKKSTPKKAVKKKATAKKVVKKAAPAAKKKPVAVKKAAAPKKAAEKPFKRPEIKSSPDMIMIETDTIEIIPIGSGAIDAGDDGMSMDTDMKDFDDAGPVGDFDEDDDF